MPAFLLKYRRLCLLALCALLGLACSHLAAVLLGTAGSRRTPPPLTALQRPAAPTAPETELGFILQHHLFDRTARATTAVPFPLQPGESGEPAVAASDLELVGTIVAGSRSLAMIRTGQMLQIHHLGTDLAGGKIEEIVRGQVVIRGGSGSRTVIRMRDDADRSRMQGTDHAGTTGGSLDRPFAGNPVARSQAPADSDDETPPAGGTTVRPAGTNSWVVARGTAEAARENLGEQLRTALIQPNLINGKTDGFVISRIQPGTLLAQMGLQPRDVIKRVNRMPLDSPEKALQIMQQLREARQITIDLERGGTPLTFSYAIE
ncbi:MAG: hypothetical protein FIB02_06120 [Desulfuromonas sp.]|nr:hypothetical protein [Desulfuromonas sp.]